MISTVIIILPTVCYTFLVILVWRVWCWSNDDPLVDIFVIIITCLLDIVLIWEEKIFSWSVMRKKGFRKRF